MDPTQMSDEELKQAIDPQPEETAPKDEAPVDPPKKEEEQPVAEEPEKKPDEQPEEEPKPEQERPSRREQLRVQQLLKKYGPPRQAPSGKTPDFRDKVQADDEVYKTLEETAKQYGTDQYQAGLSQAEFTSWRRFLRMDENQIRTKYDVLNPSNEETYHPALEKALQDKYLRFVGYDDGDPERGILPSVQNTDVTYLEFVEAEMEFADEIAAQRNIRTTQNIVKQAANAGLRPDGSSAKPMNLGKAPEDMTDEELNAAIKATMPRDPRGRFMSQK